MRASDIVRANEGDELVLSAGPLLGLAPDQELVLFCERADLERKVWVFDVYYFDIFMGQHSVKVHSVETDTVTWVSSIEGDTCN